MSQNPQLEAVLRHAQLVTPSPVAIRVVNTASHPDCSTADLAAILSLDPVLCGKVLRAVNSCIFGGRGQPIASVDRAIVVLGLNALRSLVLSLSLPIAQSKQNSNPFVRDFWLDAVSGGILAKELSIHRQGVNPGYDLVAGLLRDLGLLLMAQHNSAGWQQLKQVPIDELIENRCDVERRIFGIDHIEVTTALLSRWKLPDDVVEPIRLHHNLTESSKAKRSWRERAELLNFVELLVNLDAIVESPKQLKLLIAKSVALFGMAETALTEFLTQVSPKIDELRAMFELSAQENHDYAAILGRGCEALAELSLRLSPAPRESAIEGELNQDHKLTWNVHGSSNTAFDELHASEQDTLPNLPQFQLSYISKFPADGFLIDQYQIRSELGRGAMGIVYAGFDHTIHREVAIKLMSPEFASSKVARLRFQREARSLAAVQHQNVICIYSVGTAQGLPYLATEFIHGGSLEDLIEGIGPLPIDQVIDLGRQMANGLAAAHQKGLLHRDIKPANIMIEAISNVVKIADFGLATGVDNVGLTEQGTLVGSPLFMSPEQIEGSEMDGRSDLFSLGSVFYFMCTGIYPFAGKTFTAVVRHILEARPTPPRTHRPDLPEWLNSLILGLLQREPGHRIPSADVLHAQLVSQTYTSRLMETAY